MKNTFWLTILALLLSLISHAQQQSVVRGVVADRSGRPLPDVVVMISTSHNAVTDSNGRYEIKKVPVGTYQLQAKSLGFITQVVTITVSPSDKQLTADITLDEAVNELEGVTVQGKSYTTEVAEQPFAVTAIATHSFNNRAADLSQILNQTAGVRIREQGGMGSRFDFSLNGLSGRQVKFFVDGIPMEYLGDAFQVNNIPANLVKQVEVYKGVVPIELGSDALGGGVNLVTSRDARPYLDASYSIGSFNTHRAALSSLFRNDSSGLILRLNGFYNQSDNDYKMNDMEVYDYAEQRYIEKDIRRFHDFYRAYMGQVEAGFANKKWADLLIFSVAAGGLDKDVQSGIFNTPVGEANVTEKNQQISLRYQSPKLLRNRLHFEIFSQYNYLNSVSTDTSSNRYSWDGKVVRTEDNGLGELVREKVIFDYDQSLGLVRAGIFYALNDRHKLKLNTVGSWVSREGINQLDPDDDTPFSKPNKLAKVVSGIAVESSWVREKLSTVVALKHYAFDMFTRNALLDQAGKTLIEDISTQQTNYGYAIAARYFVTSSFLVKASYESAYRLPEPRESLGDGYRIIAAPFLRPEQSHNLNAGFQFRKTFRNANSWFAETNFFRRDVDDWIFLQSQGMLSQHINIMKVLVRGIELDARYNYRERLTISANVTYQDVLNNEKYVSGTTPPMDNRFYHDRLSNTPYLFGNASLDYKLPTLLKAIEFSSFFQTNYVHEFNLVYSRASQVKNVIPPQLVCNAGVTCSTSDNRYNVSFEVRNLFNEEAFDNFRMQKPGRAVTVKFRYFIQ